MEIAAAFMIGLLGSLHCIGMCGPIALALPLGNINFTSRLGYVMIYNGGRIITYGVIGAIFGIIGLGFSMLGWQQFLSIFCGTTIILITLVSFPGIKNKISERSYKLVSILKGKFGKFLQIRSQKSLFILGLINGLLPCGLVYIALAGSTATGNPYRAMLFMFFFGLGTLPAMATIGLLKNSIHLSLRTRIKKIIPVISVMIGILLILRGLNLGIPYLSPEQKSNTCETHCCH